MDPKIDTFCQIDISDLAILGVNKSHFLDFYKDFLELFWKFMGIVFRLKIPNFSPLGSCAALKNVDKTSPGLFICFAKLNLKFAF